MEGKKKSENKTANQINLDKLEGMFGENIPMDQIWKSFKENSFDFDVTVRTLTQIASPKQVKQASPPKSEAPINVEEESDKKKKFRTSEEVFNKIKWSPEYNVEDFIVGYEDRFIGIVEASLENFSTRDVSHDNFIPWHRVQYYKMNDKIVWDRKARIDHVFGPKEEDAEAQAN